MYTNIAPIGMQNKNVRVGLGIKTTAVLPHFARQVSSSASFRLEICLGTALAFLRYTKYFLVSTVTVLLRKFILTNNASADAYTLLPLL